jgi:hypothetical protein
MVDRNSTPAAGQLRVRRLLDSEATYRVIACDGDVVEVEVVNAPGLEAGRRFSFTADAVTEMELVGESSPSQLAARSERKPRLA